MIPEPGFLPGATGNATPLRRMSLPRLLEPETSHRSAPVRASGFRSWISGSRGTTCCRQVVCLCDSEALEPQPPQRKAVKWCGL